MRLKLDLHPIYNDTAKIETALQQVIDQANEKRIDEVEIIPGKGSGALKKSVLRFLDRPEVKARYHRFEKDGDNWGRLFVHFKHERGQSTGPASTSNSDTIASYACFCCGVSVDIRVSMEEITEQNILVRTVDCPSCGSPNKLTLRSNRQGLVRVQSESGYEE